LSLDACGHARLDAEERRKLIAILTDRRSWWKRWLR
jgi:hypothetical protein